MRPITIGVHVVILLILLLITLAPVISVAIAGTIAEANGCRLDESQAYPCVINGVDRGGDLYTLGMLGWFMLVTLPIGGAVIVLYLLALIGYVVWRKVRRSRVPSAVPPA